MSMTPWTVYMMLGAVLAASHVLIIEKNSPDWPRIPTTAVYCAAVVHALVVRGTTLSVIWRLVCLSAPVGAIALLAMRGLGWSGGSYEVTAVGCAIVATLVRLLVFQWTATGEKCLDCGYCLKGNVSGRCPECGLPISPGGGCPRLRIRSWVKRLLAPGTYGTGR
jgi:hypothetical protein